MFPKESRRRRTLSRVSALALAASLAAGCSAADRLANVGSAPKLSAIEDPTALAGYRPVHMPMPAPEPPVFNSNSLWRSGSRAFFKDQRAHRIGDILTINVLIADRAVMNNSSARSRQSGEDFTAAGALGNAMIDMIPDDFATGSAVVGLESDGSSAGSGTINRREEVRTNVAAVVTQVLPNGNLVIEGRQEIRVNYEMRELIVAGIVRPEDISSSNVVDSQKIAEARISYGGRGQITDVQQPRYGQQILDILLPF